MRALSIRQPFAELILRGIKTVEYRSRPTRIIGERFHIESRPLIRGVPLFAAKENDRLFFSYVFLCGKRKTFEELRPRAADQCSIAFARNRAQRPPVKEQKHANPERAGQRYTYDIDVSPARLHVHEEPRVQATRGHNE